MLSPRQIHLDFHTSELIPDVAADFNATAFAKTAQEAAVSSMTVFARCHHGWLYYPSTQFPLLVHPHLQDKNLLLEQVRALHQVGIRAPVYITVQWDYHSATTHPEWLIRDVAGAHEGDSFTEPGFYQSLCINTSYMDFLMAHTAEVCTLLGQELDGVFFDIVGLRPCLCASCRAEMKAQGTDIADAEAVRAFAKLSLDRFKARMTELVRQYSDTGTIFYNAGHVGPATRTSVESYSHFELESLPSGSWGYLHFPTTARYARTLGLDCMGMTGKFHTEWGDFHSLKNLAALEFESFRMLSMGFACSIGDQLEPCGTLNAATYRLIGEVYRPFAAREAWARPSAPLVEAALITPENIMYEHLVPETILGATQMLEELALQFDILDPSMSLDGYRLVILPDDLTVNADFQQKLEDYVAAGGAVLACGQGGLCAGEYPASFGVQYRGKQPAYPDFIRPQGVLGKGLETDTEYVIYQQGNCLASAGAEVLLWARAPYFKREGDRFCSHRYTPSAKGEAYPAALQNGKVILFGHPLFGQYRTNAPRWCKRLIGNAVDVLLGHRLVTHDGPSTMTVSLLAQPEQNRVCAHLLCYVPVRKSATIDLIEERTKLRDLTLKFDLPQKIVSVRVVPEELELPVVAGCVTLPELDGYAILELNFS